MQAFKTITQTTKQQVHSVHYLEAHKVLTNAQQQAANLMLEYDSTGCSYAINAAQIFANLTNVYYNSCDDSDYISVQAIMDAITNCLTYYDDEHMYTACVKNTALAKLNLHDYAYLSN